MKIYFINSKKENCGVYQYGLRMWNILKHSNLDIKYFEIETLQDFQNLNLVGVDILFFNFIEDGPRGPFGWYTHNVALNIRLQFPSIKIYRIKHTSQLWSTYFDDMLDQNPLVGIARPLYEYDINKEKPINDIINIGSFGFAGDHKGFDYIVQLVNDQYTEAQINLHITNAYYGDINGAEQSRIIDKIKRINLKNGIKLNITSNFIDNNGLLDFTYSNDIIILAYRHGEDISSTPDYPISTNTPIGLTNIAMFKHIYVPEIDINKNEISKIIEFNKNTNYVASLRNEWSHNRLINNFENFINKK